MMTTELASALRTNSWRSLRCSVSCMFVSSSGARFGVHSRTARDADMLSSLWQRQLRLVRVAPIETGDLADALHQFGMSSLGKLGDLRGAFFTIFSGQFDLDQLMVIQGDGE